MESPRLDVVQAAFFRQFWPIIQTQFMEHAIDLFTRTKNMALFNETVLHLIPKKSKPKYPTDFRSITFYNVSYKILTKLLANHLKPLLPLIILKTQGGFVSRRGTTDNAL